MKRSHLLASVIVPMYHAEKFISATFESAMNNFDNARCIRATLHHVCVAGLGICSNSVSQVGSALNLALVH
jgi:hypothetical protein